MNEESVQVLLKELDYVYNQAVNSDDIESMMEALKLKIDFNIYLDSRESSKQA